MKTIKQFLMLVALVGAFTTSCEKDDPEPKDPLANLDFQVNPEDAGINEKVEFTANNSTLGTKYEYKIVGGDVNELLLAENGVASYKFSEEGTYTVSLSVDGTFAKPEHTVDVSASNYKSPVKLYISTLTNIFEVDMSEDVKEAVDTDLKAGKNALTIKWANDKLYIFDAGSQVGYSNRSDYPDEAGSIKTFDPATFSTTTLITFTDRAYDDAFYGFVDADNVYWANRNFGLTAISVDSQDKVFAYDNTQGTDGDNGEYNKEDEYPYFINSIDLADMFGTQTYAYNGGFEHIGAQWYFTKNSHESGGMYIVNGTTGSWSADHPILQDYNISTFVIVGNNIFFVDNREKGLNTAGIYVSDLDGEGVKLIDGSVRKEIASADAHATIIADEANGLIYWTYRATDDSGEKSGIKAFPINYSDDDDLSDEITLLVEVDEPLSIALSPVYE